MSHQISVKELINWCSVPARKLSTHPERRVNLAIYKDGYEMGEAMAEELISEIIRNNKRNRPTRAIIPCGPKCWYAPFTRKVNEGRISLKRLVVFHMDECLDWQGRLLPKNHPYNFRTFMERFFYNPVKPELAVPARNRYFLTPASLPAVLRAVAEGPIDITLGGWGQDGHIAYNQARRNPYSKLSLDDLRNATGRVQDNNMDTLITLGHRSFGAAWQLVPPMSVTLGIKECLSARKVRLFSDTGAWKQTALRVALFGPMTPEYPMTLCQEHPDALITATRETASHPVSEHPEWELF